jgi:hypothetical protein
MDTDTQKVAMVTGSSNRIGATIASHFAYGGYSTIFTHHEDKAVGQRVVDAIRGAGIMQCSVNSMSLQKGLLVSFLPSLRGVRALGRAGYRLRPRVRRSPRVCCIGGGQDPCTVRRGINVLVSEKRDRVAIRRFFTRALEHGSRPSEVSTDRAPAYPRVLGGCCRPRAMSWSSTGQSDRVLSWTTQVLTQAHVWPQTAPLVPRDQCRTRIRPEHPPRPLRTQHGTRPTASASGGLRRTRPRHLIGAPRRSAIPTPRRRKQCPVESTASLCDAGLT